MYRFQCDYTEGAHPAIMQRIIETRWQTNGYGLDPDRDSARQKIKDLCECQDMDVHFLVGGTQTNTTVISGTPPISGAVAAVKAGNISMYMRQGQSKQPDIKYCRFQVKMKDCCRTSRRDVPCSLDGWKSGAYGTAGDGYISHPTEKTEHCIQRRN